MVVGLGSLTASEAEVKGTNTGCAGNGGGRSGVAVTVSAMATVLVVEDDPENAQMITEILGREGHRVLTAALGDEGLESARAWHPDAILLDVALSGPMTGFEVCRALRAEAGTATTPIIMVSAWAFDSDLQAGWSAGCNDYLAKPFAASQLLAVVQEHLDQADSLNRDQP